MDRREERRMRKQEQVREEILGAAGQVILDKGLGGLTLAAIGRRLQLSKAALYHYFDSKEALVFELIFQSLERHAETVAAEVEKTSSGADALEALIRTAAAYYAEHMDELRLAYLVPQVAASGAAPFVPEQSLRVRPLNDRIFGSVAARIASDQKAGVISSKINGRRLAFLAHTSVLGMLTMEGMIQAAKDAPLMHTHQAMLDELVIAYRARLALPE